MPPLTNRNAAGREPGAMFNSFGKQTVTTTIANDAKRTSAVDFRGSRGGVFQPDANFDGAVVTFEACDTPDGTFTSVEGATGTAITVTGMEPSKWYPLPAELAGVYFFRFVCTTDQATTETTFKVCPIA